LFSLRRRLNPGSAPLLVAGSVRSGEEGPVLQAFARTRQQGTILLAAPRHISNAEKWYKAASLRGWRVEYWSRITVRDPAVTVIILDEMGPLFNFYGLAAAVFVGGSLVNKGGHNPLEPAAWGKPLAYGPYMQDFSDALAHLSPDMARMVSDAGELGQFWMYCLENQDIISHMAPSSRTAVLALGRAAGQAAELIRKHLDE
jgi:3-deoxy-D-manno-octulosonic-acid transferase